MLFLFFNQKKTAAESQRIVKETYDNVVTSLKTHVNIYSIDSKMMISMLTTKAGKCRFTSIIGRKSSTIHFRIARELNVDRVTVIKYLRNILFK